MVTDKEDVKVEVLEEMIDKIKKLGFQFAIGDWNKKRIYKLSSRALSVLMERLERNNDSLTNMDKLSVVKELRDAGVSEIDVKEFLDSTSDYFSVSVKDGEADVYFRLGDGYGGEGICFMTGDCDNETFPMLKKLMDKFGGEVYSVDGGHESNWNEFLGKEDKDE
jgi:hypothetical protein